MKIIEVETSPGVKMNKDISVEQDHLISIMSNGQRGRIEEQRCSLGPSQVPVYNSDPEELYQLLVNSQSHRLDNQRMAFRSLPEMETFAIRKQKEVKTLKTSFDQICNMIGRNHNFRRRNPSKIPLSPESMGSVRRASCSPSNPNQHCNDSDSLINLPFRSASFSLVSDKDPMDYGSFQDEQDQLFCLVSQSQRGSIDEQCCSINPLSHSPSPSDQDAEEFFTLIANTQNRRLDDQRATVNLLPEIQTSSAYADQESDQLFNIVSRIQGSRIDDQRCSAPQIKLSSPAPPRESYSRPISPTVPPSESRSSSTSHRRSTSFSPVSEEQNCCDQDQFFSLVHHVQQRRMDDQRCLFEPSKHISSTPKTPNITPIATEDPKQISRRQIDQRVSLSSLPGLQSSTAVNHRQQDKISTPKIILTPASPAAPKKAHSRPASPTLMLCDSEPVRPPPRSASEEERLLYDDVNMQITFQISMRFPPRETNGRENQPCQFPEVFLTIGQPGEAIVLPLNLKPGRPVSFNVNSPKTHHSRSTSPHRSPARQEHRSSSPNVINATGGISPHEDYFSLIQRVHTAQLQQNNRHDRGEMSREDKRGKEKKGGRKEKKIKK